MLRPVASAQELDLQFIGSRNPFGAGGLSGDLLQLPRLRDPDRCSLVQQDGRGGPSAQAEPGHRHQPPGESPRHVVPPLAKKSA